MRICAFVLACVLLLLVSGKKVGSLEGRRLDSDRSSASLYNSHEAINNHPAQPIVKVASVDSDRRMTEEAYAKANGLSLDEVGSRFAASGILRCPGGASSAQVTGARDVITTVAHAFRPDCKSRTPPDKCTFEYYRGAEMRTVPLSATLWMGTCIDNMPRQASGDWAVAKLDFFKQKTAYEIYERSEILVELERVLAVVGYDIEATGKRD